ncbi:MAG TPA: hypothetical protein VKR58_10260 [Aquella sp.]|nr:hypothetical protein [Aquella sp.]
MHQNVLVFLKIFASGGWGLRLYGTELIIVIETYAKLGNNRVVGLLYVLKAFASGGCRWLFYGHGDWGGILGHCPGRQVT